MFNYARSDTHFLLYIYDNMRNELIDKSNASHEDGDLIELVMNQSKEEVLQRYERPFYDIHRGSGPMGWYNMLCRTPALFSREQFAVFRAVHHWRDRTAREDDESVHIVMPKHVLYNLAREMPVDIPSLLGSSHPISRSFKSRKSDLLAVIKQAKVLSHKGPDMKELMHTMQPVTANRFSQIDGAKQVKPAAGIAKVALPPQLQRNASRLPAQSKNSHFWGSTVTANSDRGANLQIKNEGLCLALPMPRLTAEIFEDIKAAGANANGRPPKIHKIPAEHQYIKDRKSKTNEVFIVKEAGPPRKRKAIDSYGTPNAEYPGVKSHAADHVQAHTGDVDQPLFIETPELSDNDTRVLGETKEGKRVRKLERRRLKKEGLRMNEDAESQKSRQVEPFDYANAPSILHLPRDRNRTMTGYETNPYAKSSDAPSKMRKAKRDQEGKSLTFKG